MSRTIGWRRSGMVACNRFLVTAAFLASAWSPLLSFARPPVQPSAVVAADGTGHYTSVQEAINAAPQSTSPTSPWIILVKPGIYREVVYVQREKHHLSLIGEDAATTTISAALSAKLPGPDGKPIGTFRTATMQIDADDFTVEGLTLENISGNVGQALAVRVDGDRVAFRRCRFLGWQDTILVNRGRHYFRDCYITGAVDFIFGGATAYFDRCEIEVVGDGYITAASTPVAQAYGLIFSHCRIASQDPGVRTYLGRPWRGYASTIFLNTEMGKVVRPAGWHNWDKPEREQTTRYVEFGSTGPGANPEARVGWAHAISAEDAAKLTPAFVLGASDGWDPAANPQ